ncbi:hypothetical protein [Oceanibium sediminis]|uniref:hypothetical protein n=1 Tax=Oceanibium sediminis TaxID=2026339 RepID=UPI0013008B14|nr:hypothetical protein [Oceanibium sediminis]
MFPFRGKRVRLLNHAPLSTAIALSRSAFQDYTVITIERDPLSRAASLFAWKHRDALERMNLVTAFRDWVASGQFRSSFPIYGLHGYPAADLVVRYERLSEGLGIVADRLGLTGAIDITANREKSAVTPGALKDLDTLYDEKTRSIVGTVAAQETALMGYAAGASDPIVEAPNAAAIRLAYQRGLKAHGHTVMAGARFRERPANAPT